MTLHLVYNFLPALLICTVTKATEEVTAAAVLKNGTTPAEEKKLGISIFFRLLFLRRIILSDLCTSVRRSVAQQFYRHCS